MKNTIPIVRNFLLAAALLAAWSCNLRQTLPFAEPERLVVLQETDADGASLGVSHDNFLAWRDSAPGLEAVSAHLVTDLQLQGDEIRNVRAVRCTVDLFETLGVSPLLGRSFVAADQRRDGIGVTVMSYGLWQDRFAGKPDVVGRQVTLDGRDHVILGILPDGFGYPDATTDLWLPLDPSTQGDHDLAVIARLSPGVRPEQAERSLNELTLPCGHGASVVPLRDAMN